MQAKDYRSRIEEDIKAGASHAEIARKIYLSYPTFSLHDNPEREYRIKNTIATNYGVDIFSVHFGGSGKTGESYHKESTFLPGRSDLDAAIISSSLYIKFLEESLRVTDRFKDLTGYAGRNDDARSFKQRLCLGVLIPEEMPDCPLRREWLEFFENISYGNSDLFKDISCWIYTSQLAYELKFAGTVKIIIKGNK